MLKIDFDVMIYQIENRER